MNPVNAIANAAGELFGVFGQISEQSQSELESETALLLASNPNRRQPLNWEAYLFIGMVVVLALVIILKIFA